MDFSWLTRVATERLSAATDRINQILDDLAGDDHDVWNARNQDAWAESEAEIPVTDAVVDFANALSEHPNTFTDFPHNVEGPENLSRTQLDHAREILQKSPAISNLRYSLCPKRLSEKDFWRIYFILLRSSFRNRPAPQTDESRASPKASDAEVLEPSDSLEAEPTPVSEFHASIESHGPAHARSESIESQTNHKIAKKLAELDFSLDHAPIDDGVNFETDAVLVDLGEKESADTVGEKEDEHVTRMASSPKIFSVFFDPNQPRPHSATKDSAPQ